MYLDQYEANSWKLDGFEDEVEEEVKETFKVDSDSKAEWAITKIREKEAEFKRIKALCDEMIDQYKQRALDAEKALHRDTDYFKSQLKSYFDKVPHKVTKTQESYALGLGKLVLKKKVDIEKDSEKLLAWVQKNAQDYIEVKESVKWGEFKKSLTLDNGNWITENGEIVDGVKAIESERFEVK